MAPMKKTLLWLEGHHPGPTRYHPHIIHQNKAEILDTLGHWPEAISLYEGNIAAARSVGRNQDAAFNESKLCQVLMEMGHYDRALERLENARQLMASGGDRIWGTKLLSTIGIAHWYLGDLDRAIDCFQQALAGFEALGDREQLANLYNNLGNAWGDKGNNDLARRCYEKNISLCRETGSLDSLQRGLGNLGILHFLAGEYEQALMLYNEKQVICQRLGNKKSLSIAIGNIGVLESARGRFREAMDCFERKLAICQTLDDRLETTLTVGNIGTVHYRQGDHRAALERYDQAVKSLRSLGAKYHLGEFLAYAAESLLRLGRADQAAELGREAMKLAQEMDQAEVKHRCQSLELRIRALGDPEGARRELEALASTSTDDQLQAFIHRDLYHLSNEQTHRQAALQMFRKLYDAAPFIEYRQAIEELENS